MADLYELERRLASAEGAEQTSLRLDLAFFIRVLDPARSISEAIKGYEEALELENTKLEIRAIGIICTAALYNKDFGESEKWISKLVNRGRELGNNSAIGRAYIFKYRWSTRAGNLSEAGQYLTKALEFFDSESNQQDLVNCYTGLGNIHFKLKDYEKAQEYYVKALPLSGKVQYVRMIIQQNIASIYTTRKEYAKAWDVYQDIIEEVADDDISTRKMVVENLGHICSKTGELQEALEYFTEAVELSRKTNVELDLTRPLCSQAHIMMLLEQNRESLRTFQEAERIAEENDNIAAKNIAYQGLIEYYKYVDDLKNVVLYQDKLLRVKEHLNNENTLERLNQFEVEHQINAYKEQGKLLYEKNRLVSEQNETLKSTMDELVIKNRDLETKLKNSIATIREKDTILTANHRLASIGEMIAIIAHQWKQPLSIINALIYTLKDAYKYEELTEDLLFEKAEMINQLVDYLSQTINDFRNFFKKQESISFKVSEALEKTLNLVSYAIENEKISIVKDYVTDFEIMGSMNELTQVFLNLINNARDAFKEDSTKEPAIKISLSEDDRYFYADFYDNGGPIPDSLSGNLFEAYVSSKGEKGTGLGLNICKTIIEDHFGGMIWYENRDNGVNFRIKFPKLKLQNDDRL